MIKMWWAIAACMCCLFVSACGDGQDLILQEEFRTQEYLADYDVQMQYQPDTATGVCRIGDTYYFSSYPSTYFYFYEIEEGTGGKLCAKPECTHDTKDCNAYIGDLASPSGYYGGTLQAYDGMLYYIGEAGTLYRMKPDGTEKEQVMKVETGNGDIRLALHRGYAYVLRRDDQIAGAQTKNILTIQRYVLGDEESKTDLFHQESTGGILSSEWVFHANEMFLLLEDKEGPTITKNGFYHFDLADGTVETLSEEENPAWRMRDIKASTDGFTLSSRNEAEGMFRVSQYAYETGEWTEQFQIAEPEISSMLSIIEDKYILYKYYYHFEGVDPTYTLLDASGQVVLEGSIPAEKGEYRVSISEYGWDDHGCLLVMDEMREVEAHEYEQFLKWLWISPDGEVEFFFAVPQEDLS